MTALALVVAVGAGGVTGCDGSGPPATTTPLAGAVDVTKTTAQDDGGPAGAGEIAPRLADEDLFPVGVGDLVGYMDESGIIVIEPRFETAGTFSEGLAQVTILEDGVRKRGFIDTTGAWVIEPRLGQWFDRFSEGLAVVGVYQADGTSLYGYVDTSGDWVVEPRLFSAEPFSEGLAAVSVLNEQGNDRYGYIDVTGEWVIEPQFDLARSFSEGLACVRTHDETEIMRWGYIDRTGAWAVEPVFDQACSFSEGLAFVDVVDGLDYARCGCIDNSGQWVFEWKAGGELIYDTCFSEGLAAVSVNTSEIYTSMKFGYVDTAGAWVIEPQFEFAHDFSEGRAVVGMNTVDDAADPTRWGYIDKTGALVVEPQYFSAEDFSGGLARVAPWYDEIPEWGMYYPVDRYRYIDSTGAVVWPSVD